MDGEGKLPLGRREARKLERRASIIEIATRHYLENGYGRTSMSAIVEQMGGSKGTLWSYFSSKEELFSAVIEEATASFRSTIADLLDPTDPTHDVFGALKTFAKKFIIRITSSEAIALERLICAEVERFPEIGHIFYDRAPGIGIELLTNYVAAKMRAGVLRKDNAHEAAQMLIGLCSGGYRQRIFWGIEKQDDASARQEAETSVRQFLRCYSITPAPCYREPEAIR